MIGVKTNNVGEGSFSMLFATPTLARLLAIFALDPAKRFFQKELVGATGSSLYLVQRELKRLEGAGLISRVLRGRQVEYAVNTGHPAFSGLREALLNTIALADRLRAALAREPLHVALGDDLGLLRVEAHRRGRRGLRRARALGCDRRVELAPPPAPAVEKGGS